VKQLLDDEKLAGETVYGEAAENPEANNLRGQLWKIYDQSGMTENVKYDFKGNLLESRRQFAQEYKNTIDWSKKPALESEEFASMTEYDALNRATSIKTPRSSGEIIPAYDDGGLLKTVKAKLRKSAQATEFVAGITYNPKGQRERITYGNGATTRYDYDDKTFRLKQLLSTRSGGADALQDLSYEYDQMGNITKITDNAQQAIYFNGQVVNPSQTFEYDALYRLTKAAGREHASINADSEPEIEGYNPAALSPEDGSAMRLYAREWEYDSVGNILQLIHKANNNSWTRNYNYDNTSNRLLSTEVGNAAVKYTYNEHGSMATTPHLQAMTWDFAERLSHITRGTTEAYYNYDGTGQRVRKTVEKGNVVEERLYLGGFEIFRKMNGNSLELERETLHIMDDVKRIAVVETKTVDNGTAVDNPAPIQRYQLSNNIESATLELDENASVISYEEYYPYGETSYRAGKNIAEVGLKRYRYTGKEKDEESGLYYYGARYYICWLGRWTAADPAGLVDGLNLYMYCRGSPVGLRDPNGNAPEDDKQMKSIPSSAYGAKSSSMAVDGLDDSINESQEREVSKYLYINGQKASGIIDKEISLNKINVDHGGYIYLEEGDNLADITKQINKEYSTTFSVDDIAKFNNIENADKVKTGDKIALPKMELFFDLKTLKVVDATYGDIPGLSWGGTSGKPGFQSQEFQSRKDKGPIPEGSYMLGNTQSYTPATSFLRKSLEKAGITNWEGTATMGGTDTWGTIRTWLEPMSGTDTYGRGGFSIHGGKEPGSAGCIDLTNMNNEFHNWLKSYAKPIILKVKYEAL
jgi:RHS repeat-associated protein